MCPTHVRLRKPGHEGRWSMCSPHVCARCRVGTGSRTSVGRQAKGSQANLEKRDFGPAVLGSRCVDVVRPCQHSLERTTRRHRVARASRTRRHRVAQRLENAQLPENFVPLDATEWHARRALDATEWRGGVASSRGCVQLRLRPAPCHTERVRRITACRRA